MSDSLFSIDINTDFDAVLAHYGILRKSGRYPWGSSGNQATRNKEFLDYIDQKKSEGLSEAEIAAYFGTTTTKLRAARSIVKSQQRAALEAQVQRMKDKGMSNVAIGSQLGINESSVRALLDPTTRDRNKITENTANVLRDNVASKGFLDIGSGVENHMGVSNTKLKTAVAMLEEEGYKVYYVQVEQLGTGNKTTIKVLTPPGTKYTDVSQNKDKIGSIADHSSDGGRTFDHVRAPESVNPKRLEVRYAEDGGAKMDGVIEIRRGVADLDLGNSRYAQVRIAVDGTHYLKGMAMYADDLPDGVDMRFNTNKSATGNKLDALKKMNRLPDGSIDTENPFGATIKPGGQKGALNIVNEEGDWGDWSRSLSSQMLSKQSPTLAKQQLNMTYESKKAEFDEIQSLTNPAVRKKLLESFADDVDSSSVHLKAAAMPRQSNSVILPINSIKETEIYAPQYKDGDRVVLVRHPHGGIFEIPELTVNNKNRDANRLIKNAADAVGINSKVAARLSGADFDGDTVLVIPNNPGSSKRIKTAPPLEKLKDFDPQSAYPAYEGMKPMSSRTKQLKMGDVSNLITDMTIRGASQDELARAVKHSMVVIDAEKHNLNWKQSAIDNGIADLKTKYQGSPRAGAATLISRASSEVRVPDRKPRPASEGGPVDKATGEKVWQYTNETYVNKDGKTVMRTVKSTKMAEAKDARTLSSNTPMENIYAEHANKLKSMANQARKAALDTPSVVYSPSAAKTYSKEVSSLNSKLNIALKNAPLERKAQLLANATVEAKRNSNPQMDPAEIKKVKGQALARARAVTGAKKQAVEINWDEWNAIQAGAVSNSKLNKILDNSDIDSVKKLATPRKATVMSDTKIRRAQAMLANGYTQAEIASQLGVPPSTLSDALAR